MIEVDKTTFFAAVRGPENIHPRSEPYHADWEVVSTRELIGRSEPGYKSPFGTESRYWLSDRFHALKVKGDGLREPTIAYQAPTRRIVQDGWWGYSVQYLIRDKWWHMYGITLTELESEIASLRGAT